MEFNEQAQN